jgi:hypothetical protein
MQHLSDPSAALWMPGDAPSLALLPVPHGSAARAWMPRMIDYWQFALLYGASPNPVLCGDLGDATAKRRIRLPIPAKATHAQVLVYASGRGVVHLQESTSAYAVEVAVQGDPGSTLHDAAVVASGAAQYSTPMAAASRMLALPDGSAPFYWLELELWKTEDPALQVLAIALRVTRLSTTVT